MEELHFPTPLEAGPRPIPRSAAHSQVPLRNLFSLSALTGLRPHPLLEGLPLVGDAPYADDGDPDHAHTVAPSSTSPPFIGMLDFRVYRENVDAANRLLSMPNCLRFRGFQL